MGNKTVFISGASSGIGRAASEIFAKNQYNLILTARSLEKLQELKAVLEAKYKISVLALELDVRKRKQVDELVGNLPEQFKNIDILINNAGLALGLEKLYAGSLDDFETMIDTNIKGLLYLTRQIVPLMLDRNINGHIINIGSLAGTGAYPNGAVYCATKAAVRFISDGLRMDLAHTPLRVTNIQPGLVETNFSVVRFNGDREKAKNFYRGIQPMTAEDIAETIYFAASRPPHVQICEITLTATHQASPTVLYRREE